VEFLGQRGDALLVLIGQPGPQRHQPGELGVPWGVFGPERTGFRTALAAPIP
jgi:hypothetical protein